MNQSDLIGELADALCKAQSDMAGAKKDSRGNFGKFADLASVWDAARPALAANNLAVVQTSTPHPDGVSIVTTLMHKSGQWIRGELYLPAPKKDPQGFGSAMTYCRRYALSAILGIAPEDDDAQGATDKMKSQPEKLASFRTVAENDFRDASPAEQERLRGHADVITSLCISGNLEAATARIQEACEGNEPVKVALSWLVSKEHQKLIKAYRMEKSKAHMIAAVKAEAIGGQPDF